MTMLESARNIVVEELGVRRKLSVKEKIDSLYPWMEGKVKRSCGIKNVIRKFPVFNWLPKYDFDNGIGDLIAGITLGLTVVPQSLAYANIAGLPPQYGLYGSFIGSFIYIFVGSCKDVPMGPTAITSLLTYQALHAARPEGLGPEYGTLLCFLCGIIQLTLGFTGLGIIIDFVSGPVSSGFTSAVAVLILTSQLKDIFGIKGGGTTFPEMMTYLVENIKDIKYSDTSLGVICIVVLLLMRLLANFSTVNTEYKPLSTFAKIRNKILWLIAISRNSIVILICGVFGYHTVQYEWFNFIESVPSGLPHIDLPPFTAKNSSENILEMLHNLGSSIIVLPVIGILEDISICKAFANGKPVDANQEFIAIGLSNIGNSFFHSYPGTGSLSRSAVANASGSKTPLHGLYTGGLVILSLVFLTPYFVYIPKASLAAVIIAAVIFMVEVRVVKPIYRSKKSDLIPGVAAFIACLMLPLEIGIIIGIGLNLVSILYHAARPKISIQIDKTKDGVEYLLITPDRCLIFPSVDYVSNLVTKHSMRERIPVVIDCSHIYGADFTAAKVIEILCQDFSERGQPLFFYNLKPSVVSIFEGVQPSNFYTYYDENKLDDLLRTTKFDKFISNCV